MKYADLKRRLAAAERKIEEVKDDARHFESEMRRVTKARDEFERRTMCNARAMMQRAIEYTPPLIAPICKCMEIKESGRTESSMNRRVS